MWSEPEALCCDKAILHRNKVWPSLELSCRDIMFLCHDRVGNGGEILCHDRIFYVAIEYFMSRQSVTKVERFCVATGKLCCDMVS